VLHDGILPAALCRMPLVEQPQHAHSLINRGLCQQDPQLRGRLDGVMTSIARAVRIGRGQKVDAAVAVRPEAFQQDEERALYDALQQAASKVRRAVPAS
jgi:glycyl-tRNA synthetase beta subunit